MEPSCSRSSLCIFIRSSAICVRRVSSASRRASNWPITGLGRPATPAPYPAMAEPICCQGEEYNGAAPVAEIADMSCSRPGDCPPSARIKSGGDVPGVGCGGVSNLFTPFALLPNASKELADAPQNGGHLPHHVENRRLRRLQIG